MSAGFVNNSGGGFEKSDNAVVVPVTGGVWVGFEL